MEMISPFIVLYSAQYIWCDIHIGMSTKLFRLSFITVKSEAVAGYGFALLNRIVPFPVILMFY